MNTEHILIVDDHPVVLDGLHSMLKSIRPSSTFSTATNAANTLLLIENDTTIDWLFLDLNLPDINGLDLIKTLRNNKVTANIVIFSSELDPGTINDALSLHVNGVLSKAFTKDVFEQCLITVELGEVFLSQEHSQELKYYRESQMLEMQHINECISRRQLETLTLLSKGFSNHDIGQHMNIAQSTVKAHVSSLMELFEATNRTHCVSEARRLKVLK